MLSADVSQRYAEAFQQFARTRGVAAAPCGPPCAGGFVQRVSAERYCREVEQAARELGDADLGLRFGAAIGGRGFGLLGIATAAAPTLAESLASLVRWEPLTSTLGVVSVSRSRDEVRLTWHANAALPAAVVEGVLAGWVAFGRFLVGEAVPVTALELAHARRGSHSEAEAIVGCGVRFNAHANAVVVPAAILDAKPRYADTQLHAALAAWLDDCVRVVSDRGEATLQRTGESILRGLAWGNLDEDQVAGHLGLARRTLQRRLAERGIGFRRMRDLLRASVAVCRLSSGDGRLIDVAQDVGFAEQATFSRAVRQWTGRSPREVVRLFAHEYAALRPGGG